MNDTSTEDQVVEGKDSPEVQAKVAGFAKRLRALRESLGLNQDDFGNLLGVRRVSQHLYENAKRVPNLNYLILLHEHGHDLRGLLGDLVDPPAAWVPGVAETRAAPKAFQLTEAFVSAAPDSFNDPAHRAALFGCLLGLLTAETHEAQTDAARAALAVLNPAP